MVAKVQKEEINFTKYEKARVIGARALQIAMGAPFLVKLAKKDLEEIKYNPVKIATQEFDSGVLPIAIRRPMPTVKMDVAEAE